MHAHNGKITFTSLCIEHCIASSKWRRGDGWRLSARTQCTQCRRRRRRLYHRLKPIYKLFGYRWKRITTVVIEEHEWMEWQDKYKAANARNDWRMWGASTRDLPHSFSAIFIFNFVVVRDKVVIQIFYVYNSSGYIVIQSRFLDFASSGIMLSLNVWVCVCVCLRSKHFKCNFVKLIGI